MKQWKIHLITIAITAVFSLLYLVGALSSLEDRLYDFFLRFRANRERLGNIVFLDIDDPAISYNGVYPWPRSIPAEGLLRLKEYGSYIAIFDIEYIEHGPQGVDDVYLNQGLGIDFNRSFTDISDNARAILSSLQEGRINRTDIEDISNYFSAFVTSEKNDLYKRAQNIARDNDLYLAQAIALLGRTWITLNLWEYPLNREQAQRRPMAEERFSYPVNASAEAHTGGGFIDVLPALPFFANAAKGAGFTNVVIDNDGVRRRLYLAQKIDDHWYLQLSFAPLIDWLGKPQIILEKNKLIIKNAQFPGDRIKDIVIPLDQKGRMMLDWPRTDYLGSYDHISFADFSLLEEIEKELEHYSRALYLANIAYFAQFDPSLNRVPLLLGDLYGYYDAALEAKSQAMENISNSSFGDYLSNRIQIFSLLREIISLNIDGKVTELANVLKDQYSEYPELAESIEDEANYISDLINNIKVNNDRRYELSASNDKRLREKFVIIGRSDTGTTDYGANPFYGKYINVGTHAVVLDTILSESFITPLGIWWRILFILIFIPLFFFLTANLPPVIRALSGFAVTLLIFGGAVVLFRVTGLYWGPLGAVSAMIIALITREVVSYAGSEKEKRFIRNAFSTYVSQDVVKEIISDPSRLQLGGTSRYMTAIFTDVKGFSTISEQLNPEALVNLLNKYLSAMSDVVLEEKGTIDKYEGDAIIAFFGAPIDLKDHALRACVSAIRMRKIEIEMNRTIMENKLSPSPLLTRIGINTGHMVAGNMGTTNKMNYTIMGNAVNLAARLEGVNKQYGTWILASEDTIKETEGKLLTRKLDRVRVVGIKTPVRLHELIDLSQTADEHSINLVNVFHEALGNFEKRNWELAAEGFNEALLIKSSDEPSRMYAERCEKFIKKPPEDSWDGVYNLTSK